MKYHVTSLLHHFSVPFTHKQYLETWLNTIQSLISNLVMSLLYQDSNVPETAPARLRQSALAGGFLMSTLEFSNLTFINL